MKNRRKDTEKRRHAAGTGCLLAGMILAAALTTFGAQENLEAEDAERLALENIGITKEEAKSVWTESDYEDGRAVYAVEVTTEEMETYEYEIDAQDGTLLDISYEKKGALPDGNGEAVTLEQAKDLAAAHAQQPLEAVTFRKEETDREDGRTVYELEFYTADRIAYEYEIDAETGAILSWDYDAWNYTPSEKGVSGQSGHHEEEHHPDEHHS